MPDYVLHHQGRRLMQSYAGSRDPCGYCPGACLTANLLAAGAALIRTPFHFVLARNIGDAQPAIRRRPRSHTCVAAQPADKAVRRATNSAESARRASELLAAMPTAMPAPAKCVTSTPYGDGMGAQFTRAMHAFATAEQKGVPYCHWPASRFQHCHDREHKHGSPAADTQRRRYTPRDTPFQCRAREFCCKIHCLVRAV